MFAYCNNVPSNLSDSSGTRPVSELERFGEVSLPVPPKQRTKIVKYNVPLYDQGDYKLCWAFCAAMIESFKLRIVLSKEDATIVATSLAKRVNGFQDWNKGAMPPNAGTLCSVNSADDLYDILLKSGPVYALYQDTKTGGDKSEHMVVVTGVNLVTNTVYVNNPWNYSGEQKFEEFLTGFAWSDPTEIDYSLAGIYPTTN